MSKINKIRNSYALKSEISLFFKNYKGIIITLIFVMLLGIITGVFTASKYSGGLELENIPDGNIVDFISGDKGSFGVFFTYFIRYLLIFLFVVFFNVNSFFNIISFLVIGIMGYITGFTIAGFVTLYSLVGVINVIILIIPFDLVSLFLLILITAISIRKFRLYKKFGSNCLSYVNHKNIYLILFLLLTIVLFIKSMLLPIIRVTIIVN